MSLNKKQINENTENIKHVPWGEKLDNTEAGLKHRRKRNDLTDRHEGTQRLHPLTNEGMRCRWSEAGKGQVREINGKTLAGGKITQREELRSNTRHTRAQFQKKTWDERTTKTGIMTWAAATTDWRNVVGLCCTRMQKRSRPLTVQWYTRLSYRMYN